jgi:hypothetical protein
MKMVTRILTVALCVSALSFGAIIDDFSVNQALVSDSTLGPPGATSSLAIGGGVTRTIGALLQAGVASASAEVAGGSFLGSMADTADGQTSSIYANPTLWDLSSPYITGLTLDVMSLESYTGGAITFEMTDGVNTATYNMAVPTTGPIFAPFAGFTGIGAVNRAGVSQLGFTFDNTLAQDIRLDNFGTNLVPEPGTYALMAAGLIGLFAIRRRKA